MRLLKFIFLAIGIGLFAFIVGNINLTEVIKNLELVGFGLFLLLFIYLVAFTIDTLTWVLTLKSIPLSTLWIYRFFQLRLAGEAFNNLTPLAGMGGEPLKAVLLKNRYEVNYPDGVASLILTKSINVLALLIFLAFGFRLERFYFSGSCESLGPPRDRLPKPGSGSVNTRDDTRGQ